MGGTDERAPRARTRAEVLAVPGTAAGDAGARFAGAPAGGLAFVIARLTPLAALFEREVDDRRVLLFLPVAFASGIGLYFGAAFEPLIYAGPAAFLVLGGLALLARARPVAFYLLALLAVIAAGFSTASLQVQRIAHPVLSQPLRGVTVAGFVESAEQRPRGSRIVIDVTAFSPIGTPAPGPTPVRVRVSLGTSRPPAVGSHVEVKADLAPPPGPAYPGGFDFGRAAWLDGIGATGYAVSRPRETPAPFAAGWRLDAAAWLEASRQAMAARIYAALPDPGPYGAAGIAVALVTGLRGGVSEPVEEAMRISGLSHILSISGLHMALVATTVFFLLRALLALSPTLVLRHPIKVWAAVPAIGAATYYLLLSGAEVATQRSYVMTLLVLVGVMAGRPALTLHTLALAALVVLAFTPWALLDPGAQMSFAATLALIVAYERFGHHLVSAAGAGLPWYASSTMRYVLALVLTSVAAGLATAPYAAFHFQRLAPLSLLANMAAMPLVSLIIMPAGLAGAVLMPFGWDAPAWWAMGWGIDAMTEVARWVAALPGADGGVRALPLASLILISLALVALCLLRTRLALVALPLAALALLTVGWARPPDLLIDAQGRTVAVRGPDGKLALMGDRAKGLVARFSSEQWIAAEGQRGQGANVALGRCDAFGCTLPDREGRIVAYPLDRAALADDCRRASLIITRLAPPEDCIAQVIRIDSGGAGRGFTLVSSAPGPKSVEAALHENTTLLEGDSELGGQEWLNKGRQGDVREGRRAELRGTRQEGSKMAHQAVLTEGRRTRDESAASPGDHLEANPNDPAQSRSMSRWQSVEARPAPGARPWIPPAVSVDRTATP